MPPNPSETKPESPKEIFLVMQRAHQQNRELLEGIYEVAYPAKPWAMYFIAQTQEAIRSLKHVPTADGLIGRLGREDLEAAAAELDIPVVNIHGGTSFRKIPQVGCDLGACGRFAAEQLAQTGVAHFAFYGLEGEDFSDCQAAGFTTALEQQGARVHVYAPGSRKTKADTRVHPAVHWLQSLPKPVAVYCPTDAFSHELATYCLQAGLDVPREVLLLGVDNDEILCRGSRPPLSSIRQPYREVGRQAAELLDRLMQGKPAPGSPLLLHHPELVERQSTVRFHSRDPVVEKALQCMREGTQRGITVEEAARLTGVSPRTLELRFKKTTGKTPQAELKRLRVELIKTHLRKGSESLESIAEACGLSSGVFISQFFQRETGMTPGQYRKIFRSG